MWVSSGHYWTVLGSNGSGFNIGPICLYIANGMNAFKYKGIHAVYITVFGGMFIICTIILKEGQSQPFAAFMICTFPVALTSRALLKENLYALLYQTNKYNFEGFLHFAYFHR